MKRKITLNMFQARKNSTEERATQICPHSTFGRKHCDLVEPQQSFVAFASGYWLPGYKLETSWANGIHVCVMHNAVETALVLLREGAAVNRTPNGMTPLHVACELSNGDCVALLLAHGAKVNSPSLSGHTPLHYCVNGASVDCAEQLILKGRQERGEWMLAD